MVKARGLLNYHAVSFHQTGLKSFSCCVEIVVYPLKHFFLLNKKKNKIMLPIRFFPDFKRKQASHIIQTVSPKKKKKIKNTQLALQRILQSVKKIYSLQFHKRCTSCMVCLFMTF